jgi:hypothetical protein
MWMLWKHTNQSIRRARIPRCALFIRLNLCVGRGLGVAATIAKLPELLRK